MSTTVMSTVSHPAAHEAAHQPQRHADRGRSHDHREHADDQRDAGAVDDPAQDVAADLIGAEQTESGCRPAPTPAA